MRDAVEGRQTPTFLCLGWNDLKDWNVTIGGAMSEATFRRITHEPRRIIASDALELARRLDELVGTENNPLRYFRDLREAIKNPPQRGRMIRSGMTSVTKVCCECARSFVARSAQALARATCQQCFVKGNEQLAKRRFGK